mgnify:CR=1 FL=1
MNLIGRNNFNDKTYCKALEGSIGINVKCNIYENRPNVCKEFQAVSSCFKWWNTKYKMYESKKICWVRSLFKINCQNLIFYNSFVDFFKILDNNKAIIWKEI